MRIWSNARLNDPGRSLLKFDGRPAREPCRPLTTEARMDRYRFLAVCTVVALPIVLAPRDLQSREQSLEHSVIGTWKLSSLYEEDERGLDAPTFGLNPEGRLVLDAAGNFSLQIVDDLRLKTSECRRGSAMGPRALAGPAMLSYFGRYSIELKSRINTSGDRSAVNMGAIHLHVDHDIPPKWEGQDRIADVTVTNDQMEFVSAIVPSPTGANYSRLVWQRLRK
jgi:hypothetical protein